MYGFRISFSYRLIGKTFNRAANLHVWYRCAVYGFINVLIYIHPSARGVVHTITCNDGTRPPFFILILMKIVWVAPCNFHRVASPRDFIPLQKRFANLISTLCNEELDMMVIKLYLQRALLNACCDARYTFFSLLRIIFLIKTCTTLLKFSRNSIKSHRYFDDMTESIQIQ